MDEFGIIKIFCINYFECILREKIIINFYSNYLTYLTVVLF